MILALKSVFERDVDLVIVRAMYERNSVSELFLKNDDRVLEIYHSATDLHGESDILVIVARNGERHAVFIEDKIDAPAQPNQYLRYVERAEKGIRDGRWNGYTIFITAPQIYLENDHEAREYPNKMSHEHILDALEKANDPVSAEILRLSLKKSVGEMPSVVDEAVSAFWDHYYDYHASVAPYLRLYVKRGKKGPNAIWPEFATELPGTKILHKSSHGNVDLQFRRKADRLHDLRLSISKYLSGNMSVEQAGGSAVVRIKVPVMDFSKPFSAYKEEIEEVFEAVKALDRLAVRLHSDGFSLD